MKRILFGLIILSCITFPLISSADGVRTITILFTGSVKGTLDPCAA